MQSPLVKSTHVTIDESFNSNTVLSVVAALVNCYLSELLKHNSICMATRNKQDLLFQLNLIAPQALLDFGLVELLDKLLQYQHTVNSVTATNNDAIVQVLNYEEIYKLAIISERSLAQIIGILIGAESAAVFDLKPAVLWTKPSPHKEVLLMSPIPRIFIEFINTKEVDLLLAYEESWPADYLEIISEISNLALVVGPPSFFTYAAACLEVPCIEIFETREQLSVNSKWAAKKYAAVLQEEIEHLSLNRLLALWKHWNDPSIESKPLMVGEVG